jgi:hypothetical protein
MIVSRSTPTFYVRFGDWFAYVCIAGLIVLATSALLHRSSVGTTIPLVAEA